MSVRYITTDISTVEFPQIVRVMFEDEVVSFSHTKHSGALAERFCTRILVHLKVAVRLFSQNRTDIFLI
jgi:hypothetical protein